MYLAHYLLHLQCLHNHTLDQAVDVNEHIIIHRNHNFTMEHIALAHIDNFVAFSSVIVQLIGVR